MPYPKPCAVILCLDDDMRLRLDNGRQNKVADEIRANFQEIIKLPAWQRRERIDQILRGNKERNDVPAR